MAAVEIASAKTALPEQKIHEESVEVDQEETAAPAITTEVTEEAPVATETPLPHPATEAEEPKETESAGEPAPADHQDVLEEKPKETETATDETLAKVEEEAPKVVTEEEKTATPAEEVKTTDVEETPKEADAEKETEESTTEAAAEDPVVAEPEAHKEESVKAEEKAVGASEVDKVVNEAATVEKVDE